MRPPELAKLVDQAKCRVFGWDAAGHDGHRAVLAALLRGFDSPDSTVLCEPSLARKTTRPPDAVLIDPLVGVHVFEVKGVTLEQIAMIKPGGALEIRYAGGPRSTNPISQVRNAMFDIKNATERFCDGELGIPFQYSVALPNISRAEWIRRWGENCYCPPEFIFGDDLPGFPETIRSHGRKHLANSGLTSLPTEQFATVWKAFGDSSVLYHLPGDREARRVPEATLGEFFDEAAETYKTLSDEQQRLSAQIWSGPRLVRGVAGSGKTIVLANNLARKLQKSLPNGELLIEDPQPPPKILAVCYNRTLVPFLHQKISVAFQQRTGRPLPNDVLDATHYNSLLWRLSRRGLWRYQKIESADDRARAKQYLAEFEHARENHPEMVEAVLYDAIYVDEGQDLHEEDIRLLKNLCRTPEGGEPNLYIFYDDAQNLLGRKRPNWKSLGLSLIGVRSNVMTHCFRNTRPIVETAFNVLYGRFAATNVGIPTKLFGDIATLEEKGLISDAQGRYLIRFAVRDGMPPRLTIAADIGEEDRLLLDRLRWLIEDQRVRPEDVLVLAHTWRRIERLATVISQACIASVDRVHVAREDQDSLLRRRGCLPLSTVASAKGYDAYCTLLASANQFPTDVSGRANFYVGCTRAIEYLEIFAHEPTGLVPELQQVLKPHDSGLDPVAVRSL